MVDKDAPLDSLNCKIFLSTIEIFIKSQIRGDQSTTPKYVYWQVIANTAAKNSPSYTSYQVTNTEMQPPNLNVHTKKVQYFLIKLRFVDYQKKLFNIRKKDS